MKVVFCGGGTGGHVYPALTVAAALKRVYEGPEPLEYLYIGVRGRMDREIVAREGLPFEAVTAGPLRVGSPTGIVAGAVKLLAGTLQAYRLLGAFRPDVVFSTGGYGSVGVGLAAKLRGVPLVLFLPDVEAGLAVRTLIRVARRVAVSVAPALRSMPKGKTLLTGYPVRPAFFSAEREQARRALGLQPDLPALLIAGGSSGASRLNRAVSGWLPDFLRVGQVIHVCGANDHAWLAAERETLEPALRERYHLHAYLHEGMDQAFAAADLAVMRAGASTLGELPAARLPAVLVPGSFSDQRDNAAFLEREGAAVMLEESQLDRLHALVTELLADMQRRESMKQALASLAQAEAAERLAGLVLETAGARQGATV